MSVQRISEVVTKAVKLESQDSSQNVRVSKYCLVYSMVFKQVFATTDALFDRNMRDLAARFCLKTFTVPKTEETIEEKVFGNLLFAYLFGMGHATG